MLCCSLNFVFFPVFFILLSKHVDCCVQYAYICVVVDIYIFNLIAHLRHTHFIFGSEFDKNSGSCFPALGLFIMFVAVGIGSAFFRIVLLRSFVFLFLERFDVRFMAMLKRNIWIVWSAFLKKKRFKEQKQKIETEKAITLDFPILSFNSTTLSH